MYPTMIWIMKGFRIETGNVKAGHWSSSGGKIRFGDGQVEPLAHPAATLHHLSFKSDVRV